ncbi:hypothetical protein CI238_10032 [Colletotrichum incanum]|uniref:Heterokaryon incompatibility domain-containing protein n=1 Tax=Colletotrichum incanum TaxID=1573173 RepID=A0A166RZT4_COLIC|nr:hypothetical protein CI238_10032 [Colletotrichum incanum]
MEYSHAWPLGDQRVPIDCWRHAEINLGQITGRTPRSDRNLRYNWFWDRMYDSLAIWYFKRRPWFYRVWILQEAALCSDGMLKCGADEISWLDFNDYYFWNPGEKSFLPSRAEGCITNRLVRKRDIPADLFDAFAMNEGSSATDPRDKIYGVLAFVRYNDYIDIEVDYSQDPADVFLKFTIATLKARPDLDILSRSQGVRKSNKDLPTWSLSWNYTEGQLWFPDSYAGHNFKKVGNRCEAWATNNSKPRVNFLEDGKVLGLFSSAFDEVVAVGIPMYDRDSDIWTGAQWFRAYVSWRDVFDLDSPRVYEPTGQNRREVFWRMLKWFLLAGAIDKTREEKEFAAFDDVVMKLTNLLPRYLFGVQIGIILLTIWDTFITSAFFAGVYIAFPSWLFDATAGWGRTMLRTSRGYVGLSLPTVEVGDRIFLVHGSKAPLVLRKHGERWLLVGEACIHGIMDAEAFDESKGEMIWIE